MPYSARIAEWGLPEQPGERLIKGEGGRPEAPMPQSDIPIEKYDLHYV